MDFSTVDHPKALLPLKREAGRDFGEARLKPLNCCQKVITLVKTKDRKVFQPSHARARASWFAGKNLTSVRRNPFPANIKASFSHFGSATIAIFSI